MRPEDLQGRDPNRLPYFVNELRSGRRFPVHFELLTGSDVPVLSGIEWAGAVFHEFWINVAALTVGAIKLCITGEPDADIQGLLVPGTIPGPGEPLMGSLLETAPFQRHGHTNRQYRGVGRVLVARLVVESCMQSGEGRLVVRTRPAVRGFYSRLGFQRLRTTPDFLRLEAADAIRLLEAVLLPE